MYMINDLPIELSREAQRAIVGGGRKSKPGTTSPGKTSGPSKSGNSSGSGGAFDTPADMTGTAACVPDIGINLGF